MLDRDLAILYDVKPTRLREQVNRNIDRFPEDFMFQLTDSEVEFMVSQNAIPSKQHLGGALPYVFTEQGVASISSVLTNKELKQSHDRFLIVDEKVYHLGASLKDLGKKWFAFSLIKEDVFELKKKIAEVLDGN